MESVDKHKKRKEINHCVIAIENLKLKLMFGINSLLYGGVR
jgi:hypothetical protein